MVDLEDEVQEEQRGVPIYSAPQVSVEMGSFIELIEQGPEQKHPIYSAPKTTALQGYYFFYK